MKQFFTCIISIIVLNIGLSQGTVFEFSGPDSYFSERLTVDGDDIYFAFTSESQSIYSTYIARWNTLSEKIEWCRRLTVDNNVSINPVKILLRKDGTILLGAYDYSWKDGFSNGNITFILFDKNGKTLQTKRLGSPTGGIMRNLLADDDDSVVFIADRTNAQSEYKSLVGRLDKDLNVVNMRAVFKDYYTYGLGLDKDKEGNIYTVGHSRPANSGSSRSIVTKWSKDLDHISTIMHLDKDPNSSFNFIHIDDENQIHLGGNLNNLVKYVRLNKDLKYEYGHEFTFGYPRNIWKDKNGHTNIFIDGPNYFVRLDNKNTAQQFISYGSVGNTSGQQYIPGEERIYNFSYKNSATEPQNRLYISSHTYSADNKCILFDISHDNNKPLSLDSFGITNVTITDESAKAIVPDDIIVSDFDLTVKEICRVEQASTEGERALIPLTLYPNPAFDPIYVKHDDNIRITKGEFIGINGNIINIPHSEIQSKTISTAGLITGIYILRLYSSDGRQIINKVNILKP